MNQSEVIDAVASDSGLSKTDTEKALKSLGGVVAENLGMAGEIVLPGVGKFKAKTQAARTGRNPRTGEEVHTPEKLVPKFEFGKAIKEAVASA